jgi:hypothetical protein
VQLTQNSLPARAQAQFVSEPSRGRAAQGEADGLQCSSLGLRAPLIAWRQRVDPLGEGAPLTSGIRAFEPLDLDLDQHCGVKAWSLRYTSDVAIMNAIAPAQAVRTRSRTCLASRSDDNHTFLDFPASYRLANRLECLGDTGDCNFHSLPSMLNMEGNDDGRRGRPGKWPRPCLPTRAGDHPRNFDQPLCPNTPY